MGLFGSHEELDSHSRAYINSCVKYGVPRSAISDSRIQYDQYEIILQAAKEGYNLYKYWKYIEAPIMFWIYQFFKAGYDEQKIYEKTGIDLNNSTDAFLVSRNLFKANYTYINSLKNPADAKAFKKLSRKYYKKAKWELTKNTDHLPAMAFDEKDWEKMYFYTRQGFSVKDIIRNNNSGGYFIDNMFSSNNNNKFITHAYADFTGSVEYYEKYHRYPTRKDLCKEPLNLRGFECTDNTFRRLLDAFENDVRVKNIFLDIKSFNEKQYKKHDTSGGHLTNKGESKGWVETSRNMVEVQGTFIDFLIVCGENNIDVYDFVKKWAELSKEKALSHKAWTEDSQAGRFDYPEIVGHLLELGITDDDIFDVAFLSSNELKKKFPGKPFYTMADYMDEKIEEHFGEKSFITLQKEAGAKEMSPDQTPNKDLKIMNTKKKFTLINQ